MSNDKSDKKPFTVIKDNRRVESYATRNEADAEAAKLRKKLQESSKSGNVPNVAVKENILG